MGLPKILQKHVKFYDVCEQKVLSAKIILSDVRAYDAATPRICQKSIFFCLLYSHTVIEFIIKGIEKRRSSEYKKQ